MAQTAAPSPISQWFNGYIQDGKIYAQSWEGTQQVGVLLSTYAELQGQHKAVLEVTEGYKQRLIDLGEIEVPLTQEQIIAQQAEQLRQSQDQLRQSQELLTRLAGEVEALTKEKSHGLHPPDLNDNRPEPESKTDDDTGAASGSGDRAKQARPPKLHTAK